MAPSTKELWGSTTGQPNQLPTHFPLWPHAFRHGAGRAGPTDLQCSLVSDGGSIAILQSKQQREAFPRWVQGRFGSRSTLINYPLLLTCIECQLLKRLQKCLIDALWLRCV